MVLVEVVSVSDKVQTKVYLPADLKALLDADSRSNSDAVEAALLTEFGGEKKAAIDRRIEEKQRRISNLESERNERKRMLKEEQEELEGLRKKRESVEDVEEKLIETAVDELGIPPHVGYDHAAAKNWADKANMDVEEFWQAYTEAYNNE